MLHNNIKALQLAIITLTALRTSSAPSFLSLALLTLSPFLIHHHFYPSIAIALALFLLSLITNFSWITLLFMLKYGALCFGLVKINANNENKGVRSLFFVCLALSSMNENYWVAQTYLFLFFLMLILWHIDNQPFFSLGIKIYRIIFTIQLTWFTF